MIKLAFFQKIEHIKLIASCYVFAKTSIFTNVYVQKVVTRHFVVKVFVIAL